MTAMVDSLLEDSENVRSMMSEQLAPHNMTKYSMIGRHILQLSTNSKRILLQTVNRE